MKVKQVRGEKVWEGESNMERERVSDGEREGERGRKMERGWRERDKVKMEKGE